MPESILNLALIEVKWAGKLKWALLFLLIVCPLFFTLSDYGITSDEPIYMEASWNIEKWLSLDIDKIFNREEIKRYWVTDTQRNVHPSGVKWLYIIAQKAIFWENNQYRQNATFNVLLFSISILIFLNWWSGNSIKRSIIPIILLLLIPRFFAHVHFPATDIPMTSFFLLFIVVLDSSFFKKYYWLSGIILGFFASIKITSILLAFPLLLSYLLWYRSAWKIALPRILFICLIGILTFYLLNPDYWYNPIINLKEFIFQSSTRKLWTPFTVYFGGQFYNYRGPWHYPFTIFSITTPILHILFLLTGIVFFILTKTLRKNFKMVLVFICLLFPFLLLALPISPAHDGIRYLLPAFPFAACFMAIGLEKLWSFIKNRSNRSFYTKISRVITSLALLSLFAADLQSPARIPPFELSYYNSIVGGFSGAAARGYENTYWWEIINDHVLKVMNKYCEDASIYFPISPTDYYFKHQKGSGKIDFRQNADLNTSDFMLIFGRPYVSFWESRTIPGMIKNGKIPKRIWEMSLDSVTLMRLYVIMDNNNLENS